MAKTILITGATRGIGRAAAAVFAAAGYSVIAVARTETDLVTMQAQWRQQFPGVILRTLAVDLTDPSGLDELATLPLADVVLCNAGWFRALPLLTAQDELSGLMEVNFWAPYRLARRLLPRMSERGAGHWITVGSVATRDDTAGTGQYAVSKYALEGLHRSLEHETRGRGLHFTLVVPGATHTSSWDDEDFVPDRILSAEEVAQAILAASANPQLQEVVIRP
jgi:short-subunit dehydrogenase